MVDELNKLNDMDPFHSNCDTEKWRERFLRKVNQCAEATMVDGSVWPKDGEPGFDYGQVDLETACIFAANDRHVGADFGSLYGRAFAIFWNALPETDEGTLRILGHIGSPSGKLPVVELRDFLDWAEGNPIVRGEFRVTERHRDVLNALDAMKVSSRNSRKDKNAVRKALRDLFYNHGDAGLTPREAAAALQLEWRGVNERSIQRLCRELEKDGSINRKKPRAHRYFFVR